jgi:probable blue pigment (indigoidine) exporter
VEDKWRWILITAIAPIAWGSTYFVTRHLLPADAPFWGATLRALPAGVLLLLLARRLPRGSWWWKSLVLGFLNVGAFFVLVYLAAQLLPTSIAATIMATSAAMLMLLAWPLLAERPAVPAVIGAAIGIGGVCVLLLGDSVEISAWGVVASVVAMLMSSVGFILTKRWTTTESPITLSAWQLLAGGLMLLPVAALVEGAPPVLDGPAIGGFAYLIVIGTALAHVAWFTGLRHLPASSVGLVGLLNPVTGVLLGVLIALEPFGPRQLIGIALVLGGVLLGQRRRTSPTRLR